MAVTVIGDRPTKYEFMSRFTQQEQTSMLLAERTATTDPADPKFLLCVFLENFRMAVTINVEDPRVGEGLDLLTAMGILAPGRKEQILTGTA